MEEGQNGGGKGLPGGEGVVQSLGRLSMLRWRDGCQCITRGIREQGSSLIPSFVPMQRPSPCSQV